MSQELLIEISDQDQEKIQGGLVPAQEVLLLALLKTIKTVGQTVAHPQYTELADKKTEIIDNLKARFFSQG